MSAGTTDSTSAIDDRADLLRIFPAENASFQSGTPRGERFSLFTREY